MADTTQNTSPLSADDIAIDVERKQNTRLLTSGAVSIALNTLMLIGAANAMNEKPLTLKPQEITYVSFIATPAPAPSDKPEAPKPTPTPAQVAEKEPEKKPEKKPEVRETPPPPKPEKIQVAQVKPKRNPETVPTPLPPQEETQPDVVQTPPPVKPVEQTVTTATPEETTVQTTTATPVQTKASSRNTGASMAVTAVSAAPAARGGVQSTFATNLTGPSTPNSGPGGGPAMPSAKRGGGASVAEGVAGGATNITGGEFTAPNASNSRATGAPSLRMGVSGGSNAPGVAGITGMARGASGISGSVGMIAGPRLTASSGPSLGTFGGGKSGQRNSILTQSDAGGAASSSDFTVAQGSGLKPGSIVARQGSAAGGAAGVNSNATLAPRVAGGGNGGGGGAQISGSVFRPSMGGAGGGSGPVGLRAGSGKAAGGGDGALGGGANGDPGGVSAAGIAGGNGAPGRGQARSTGLGGAGGSGEGVRAGARGGVAGMAAGEGINGKPGGSGGGSGPGGGDGGPVGRGSGVGAGSGAGSPGAFGVKGGAGSGADLSSKGTGTSGDIKGVKVETRGAGGGGADIQSNKLGSVEMSTGGDGLQVKGDGKKESRSVSGPTAGGLSDKVDQAGFTAITEAKILSRAKPVITEDMKSKDPKRVVVEFTVGANGSASYKIVGSSGDDDVDAAVLRACAGYKWQAATRGGKPTESKQRITFDPKE